MMALPLTRGAFALVDDEDYERFARYSWQLCSEGYAVRGRSVSEVAAGQKATGYLHRELMNPPPGLQVDHINGNKLDNRRENLRLCNHSQNFANGRLRSNNTSGYRGVCRRPDGRWVARMKAAGGSGYLGAFDTPEDAARAYDAAAAAHYGEFYRPNLPPEPPALAA